MNPNSGKRKASKPGNGPRLSCGRNERTACGEAIRTGVTVVHADPAYLRRFGAAAAVKSATGTRPAASVTLVARNATRQRVGAVSL